MSNFSLRSEKSFRLSQSPEQCLAELDKIQPVPFLISWRRPVPVEVSSGVEEGEYLARFMMPGGHTFGVLTTEVLQGTDGTNLKLRTEIYPEHTNTMLVGALCAMLAVILLIHKGGFLNLMRSTPQNILFVLFALLSFAAAITAVNYLQSTGAYMKNTMEHYSAVLNDLV